MLHGELPFDNENISELSQTICNGKYKMKKTVSEEAKDLINRMLQPNPFIRITISEILAHPWFSIDVPKYLRNFYEIPSNLQNVDSELTKKIFEYYDDLTDEEIQKIVEDIENGESNKFCVHYSFLARAKMMSVISDLKMEGQSNLCFNKRKISKRKRQNIKSTHQVLEGLSKRINASESNKNKLKALKTDGLERTNSILSNSTITSKTDEDSITKNNSNIGLVYKGKLEDLFRVIFTQLKRMNIVWKSLGSGYVFKCKNEDAQSESIRNEIRKEEFLQYMKSDKFKFYLQIDKLQQTKNSEDESPISCSEYLVSFIWINGAIQNFLDFMNIFKSSIEELL